MTSTYIKGYLDPWRHFETGNRINDWDSRGSGCDYPAVNVWLNGASAELTAEVPGLDHDSIDISVSGDTVTLSGKRTEDTLGEGDTYSRHELRHGDFSKSIRLPFKIDSDKVGATYGKGILKVSLCQAESEKPRSIKIKSE